jgi:nitrogen-specific signal transduction histidine kinase
MGNKQRFSLLLRPDERRILQRLAEEMERSQSGALRRLIRQAAHELKAPLKPGERESQATANERAASLAN